MSWHLHARGEICPICGVERKPTGSAYKDGIRVGGHVVSEERIESELAYDGAAEVDKFFGSDEFRSQVMNSIERNSALALHGNLPPVAPPDDANSRKVLAEATEKFKEGVANA